MCFTCVGFLEGLRCLYTSWYSDVTLITAKSDVDCTGISCFIYVFKCCALVRTTQSHAQFYQCNIIVCGNDHTCIDINI